MLLEEAGAIGGSLLSKRVADSGGERRRVGRSKGKREERRERKERRRKGKKREREGKEKEKEKRKCLSEIPIL